MRRVDKLSVDETIKSVSVDTSLDDVTVDDGVLNLVVAWVGSSFNLF